ncbi:choice-of-anchor L domain-containing protein, partial [Psychroflexus planctonicus]|uniref:choice-of-anchor L domain-containing protein n=1 Tax=Psychroflexus planctonicus TaxID=1526575 RepID=UPI0016631332
MLKKFLPLFILLFSATTYSQDYNWLEDLEEDDQINTCESTLIANNDDGQISNYNHTLVICPDEEGLLSTIDFTEFDIPDNNFTNQFVIYDGDNTDAPVLFTEEENLPNGGYISATEDNPTGCITIVYDAGFVPPNFTAVGFEAVIDCREPCQDLEAIILSIEADNVCSEPGSDLITFPQNEGIIFNADANASNETPNEDLTFTWEIDEPNNGSTTLTGESPENAFNEPGLYQGTLVVTDEFFCESDPVFFSFEIGTNELSVSPQDDQFTLQELIEDVMVGGGDCANVNNITSPISSPNGSSIGYFSRGCSSFPFEEGLVIGSAGIGGVVGDFGIENSWSEPGGAPNEQLLATVGGNPGNSVNDATVIEFEFSSFESEVSFDYIFASMEYTSSFPCTYADPFAFIVSGPGINDENTYWPDGNPANEDLVDLGGLNVATIIPDGESVPVPTTASNIHPGQPNFNCGPGVGQFFYPEFFQRFPLDGDPNNLQPPYHSINGETKRLTASFNVIPCETYTMKLMVADWNDTAFNSFVFIEGGSFNIGADLGDDITIETDFVLPYGEEQELTVFGGVLDSNCDIEIDWFLDGNLIEGANDASYNATESGTYTVFIGGDGGCNDEDSVVVEFLPAADYGDPGDNPDEPFPYPDISFCGEGGELENGLLEIDPFDYLVHNGIGQPIPDDATSLEDLNMEAHYFESEQDAIDFENPIENPEDYNIPPGNFTAEIWIRVNENITGDRRGAVVESFQLIFFERPEIEEEQVEDLANCGDFTPPTQIFDLTQNNATSIGVQDPSIVDVSYHITEVDAESNENPIDDPENYTLPDNINQQTIFLRAENTGSDDCYDIATFEIFQYNVEIANPLPTIDECQIGESGEGLFNLTQQNGLVLGANQPAADYSISYFEEFADANGGVNPITDPTAFESAPQEIWVRIDNVNSVEDCFAIDSFQIDTIETTDVNLEVTPLEACDENNDGFFSGFDLASRVDEINYLEDPEVQVSFHPTASDAETGQNPLASPYANVEPSQQTLYVRIFQEIEDLQCVQTTTLDLFIYNSPLLEEIEPIIACDTNETGIQFFDLTQVEADLFVEGQNTEDFEISYHLSQNAANNNSGLIGTPTAYQNQTSPQTVYVRVSDPTSPLDCYNIEPIELIVDPLPEITPPTLLAECDDVESGSTTDETSSFDLSQKIEEITNANNALEVVFYANESDQENN